MGGDGAEIEIGGGVVDACDDEIANAGCILLFCQSKENNFQY